MNASNINRKLKEKYEKSLFEFDDLFFDLLIDGYPVVSSPLTKPYTNNEFFEDSDKVKTMSLGINIDNRA